MSDAAFSLPDEVKWFLLMHSDNVAYPNWIETILGVVAGANERVASVCSSYDIWAPGISLLPGEDQPDMPMRFLRYRGRGRYFFHPRSP